MNAKVVRLAKRIAKRIIWPPIFGRSILIYHRIAHADFDPWNLAVLPDEFEGQLARMRNKTVLPLQEFVRLHVQKRLPRNAVAITFDDGYACNALVAAPILVSFGYPATFFIVSDDRETGGESYRRHGKPVRGEKIELSVLRPQPFPTGPRSLPMSPCQGSGVTNADSQEHIDEHDSPGRGSHVAEKGTWDSAASGIGMISCPSA